MQHLIFDLTEPCICTRRITAQVFEDAKKAAKFLGCRVSVVFENRTAGKRIKSRYDGIDYAVRLLDQEKINNQLWETNQ